MWFFSLYLDNILNGKTFASHFFSNILRKGVPISPTRRDIPFLTSVKTIYQMILVDHVHGNYKFVQNLKKKKKKKLVY